MRNFKPFAVAVLLAAFWPAAAAAQSAPTRSRTDVATSGPDVSYHPDGRRDPFKNLFGGKELAGQREPTSLSDLMIDDISIIGLVYNKGRYEVVLSWSSRFPWTAHEGDHFADGYVLSIRDNEVVLRKTKERGIPLLKPKDIVKEITS